MAVKYKSQEKGRKERSESRRKKRKRRKWEDDKKERKFHKGKREHMVSPTGSDTA